YLERYLYKETYHLLLDVVNEKAEGMSVREEDKQFIAYFYQFAFVGLLLDWIDGGMKEEPKNIIDHVSILVQGDITKALERYRIDKII
ncbi:MAG: TetR-like C-terminal domain-containing protein, partial [Anaerovoracaceae bacterium]